jgi:predicted transcriptional regulator
MDVLWTSGSGSVADVVAKLNQGRARPLAYTTVLTVLGRLTQKSLLRRERKGRQHVYRPAVARSEFLRHEADRAVQEVLADFGELAVAGFLDVTAMKPEHQQYLAEWLRSYHEQQTSPRG